MLTKTDLEQLKTIIDNSLDEKLDEKLEAKFEEKLSPIQKDLSIMKKDIKKMRKDLDVTISYFDRVTSDHEVRLRVVERLVSSS